MTSLSPRFESDIPEWRRSGLFFFIAIVLHAAVLFYPLKLVINQLKTTPPDTLAVSFITAEPALPKPVPIQPPQPEQPQPKAVESPRPVVQKKKPVHPVMAIAPTPNTPPAEFTAPPVAAAPPTPTTESRPTANAGSSISAPRFDAAYLENPRPKYPPLSRRLGEEGKVLLKVKVDSSGHPATVNLEKTSNFERLDEAARQAVLRWRFIPAKRGEESIEASVIVPVVFRLES